MAKSILTIQQRDFLSFFKNELYLTSTFYLSGGTCLAEYYLQHRYSEDLDFFSENEFELQSLTAILKSHKSILGYKSMDFQQSFNRNLFFLKYSGDDQLKIEFTYFPFSRVESTNVKDDIQIDSLQDIAINKLFTVYQKPRGRDFYDLYAINQKSELDLKSLMKLVRIKFDTNIDPLQLGRNFMQVDVLMDDPIVVDQKYKDKEIVSFIHKLGNSLGDEILSK